MIRLVSFEDYLQMPGMPIYLQIIRCIKQGLVAGTVCDGEEMPSRRVLSALLAVNPNTVQKAYRQLEEEGLVVSRAGAKSYISAAPEQLAAVRRELLEGEMQAMVETIRRMGLTKDEAHALLEQLYEKEETVT